MLLTTTEKIPGRDYIVIGMVEGSMILSKNVFKDIGQGLKGVVGGELRSYGDMMTKSREGAKQRMAEQAASLRADAVVSVRYATSSIMQGAAEMLAYGTAVRFVQPNANPNANPNPNMNPNRNPGANPNPGMNPSGNPGGNPNPGMNPGGGVR